jgi:uncharacterized protein YjiS (DUF1127 family)
VSSYIESGRRYHRRTGISTNSPATLARNIVAMVRIWRARARVRRELAALSARELQDMATCWSSIADEVNKPFWRA